MTPTDKLITDNLWRDISELPRDESMDVYVFILGEDLDVDSYKTGWYCKRTDVWLLNGNEEYLYDDLIGLTDGVFMKINDRCANALKVAVGALEHYAQGDYRVGDSDVAREALAEINRIANNKGE